MDLKQKSELNQSAATTRERVQQILSQTDLLSLSEFEKKFADKVIQETAGFDFRDHERKTKGWVRITVYERSLGDEA